jgi:ketol-acid reductoisomerase
MRHNLLHDIKGGAFVNEWSGEQSSGSQTLARLKEQARSNPMSTAEEAVIALMGRATGTGEN